MGVHTELNTVQSEFNLERLMQGIKQVIEEFLNNRAELSSEEDSPVQEFTAESRETGTEKTEASGQIAASEPIERGDLKETMENSAQFIDEDTIGSVPPGYKAVPSTGIGSVIWNARVRSYWHGLDIAQCSGEDTTSFVLPGYESMPNSGSGSLLWNARVRPFWYGHAPEKPTCSWKSIYGQTTNIVDQLKTMDAMDTGGRADLMNRRTRKKRPWMICKHQLYTSAPVLKTDVQYQLVKAN